MEAARAAVVAVGSFSKEVVEERLLEARKTYKLNFGYAGLTSLPPGFVDMVKKFNPHITELELSSNTLTDLPDELEELQYLRTVRIKYNQLKKIPAVLMRLPQLMHLELSGNQILSVGDAIGSLQILRELDLSGNSISSLSDSLCTLQKLEVLNVDNNKLEVLPASLGDLSSLIKLDISNNGLINLPASLGGLKKVQRIDCSNNLLAKVPPSMGHLKNIKEFNLRYNRLDEKYNAKVEEGLSRLLAFLREEEERERLEEIDRLKPIGTPVGAYLEYRCKADPNQVLKTENHGEVAIDNRCWIRQGHSLTQVGPNLVIFGGTTLKDMVTTSDVFWMTMDRMEWHLHPCKGDKPPARHNHSAIFDEDNNRLVIFGGRTAERKRLNDVWFLDLESFTWYRPNTEGSASPAPRELAASAFWAGNMVIFGGNASNGGRTNDLWRLDLSSWQWSQPPSSGTSPSPRQNAAICIGHSNLLFVSGGRNNFVLEDLHVLNFVSNAWTEISFQGRAPPPRHGHQLSFFSNNLYLFGGLDELGAQSASLYRMHLPPEENYATAHPEWREWESELPYNKCRTCTLFQGALSAYQLGSTTLGRVNDEDAEKGLVFFDVFKTARLEALKPKVLNEDELKPKNSKRSRVLHTTNIASKMPRSFNQNSALEARALTYLHDFKRKFEDLYPYRRPLFLTPKNECGVPKFVCTTLRPSQLSYTELYDLDGCCSFVADFMAYEGLEDPLHPPEHLPSPMNALSWQAGDSFDLSVLLASLLIGSGFDAYVVMGYAPASVTEGDQKESLCPVLEKESAASDHARIKVAAKSSGLKPAASSATPEVKKPKYVIKPSMQLESKFQKQQREASTKEGQGSPVAAKDTIIKDDQGNPETRKVEAPPSGPPFRPHLQAHPSGPTLQAPPAKALTGTCRTVHAWVLVMSGKRDIAEAMFVEPSTGRRYPVNASPYQGIELLWNHLNFWVCMQMPLPHSDSRALPSEVSFDLSDPLKWEAVFEGRAGSASAALWGNDAGDEAGDQRFNATGKSKGLKDLKSARSDKTPKGLKPKVNTAQSLASEINAGATDGATSPGTAGGDGGSGGLEGVEAQGGGDSGPPPEPEVVPETPPSWVPKLSIPRDAFDMRCPRGNKLTLYYRCQHEIFARFGDCSRYDGMVEKLIVFADDDRTQQVEILERFQRRKDKLYERQVYLATDTVVEYFEPGSSFGLKDLLTIRNERKVMNFYASARLDGLLRREEVMGKKLTETFDGRDDRLVYRSGTYIVQDDHALEDCDDDEERGGTGKGQGATLMVGSKRVLPLRKMTEKFARNPATDPDSDIARRVYYLAENKIQVDYHFGADRVTFSNRTFFKDGQSQIVHVDPLAVRPEPGALLEQYQALLLNEDECQQSMRDVEWEISEIVRTRTNQEQKIALEEPYYDIVRIKAEESDEEEEAEKEAAYDFLSPFLPPLIGMQQLSKDQALEVREKCLRALKDRLIERANIIQMRLDEDTASLSKRQASFNRDRDQMSQEEEEEYERAVEESMFRIHILEKRLRRHEEQALHKYYELDHKLRTDPRMCVISL